MRASTGIDFRTRAVASSASTFLVAAIAAAQSTSIVSYDASGAFGNEDAFKPTISADGRYVVFQWYDNLTEADIFLADRTTGALERISVSSSEVKGNSYSYHPKPSADSRYVAFSSWATNLVPGDTNGTYPNAGHDVFVRDRVSGTTERVSVGAQGQQASDQSFHPAISSDGRYVAFTSYAPNLVSADANGVEDVFLRDRAGGTTELVSVSTSGAQGNGGSTCHWISADARFVAFMSSASNLVAGDTNAFIDVFVRDRLNGTTQRVSVASNGAQANADSYGGMLTPDGRYVTFQSAANDLVPGDTNGKIDVFVRDLAGGVTERLSLDSSGVQGNGDSAQAALTPDGRFAAFQSTATNLVAGDSNGYRDIFLRDRLLGTTQLVSVDSNGAQGNNHSGIQGASITPDARYIAFDTRAQFVATDLGIWHDIYVRDRGPQQPNAYCTPGTSSNGCSATIAASANPSVSLANACTLTVSNVDGQRSGLFFYGIDNSGLVHAPWAPASASVLCVKAPAQRTAIQSSGGTVGACDGSFALDWNAYQTANPLALGNPWSAGAHAYVQAVFRDVLAPKASNLSNAIELTYRP